MVAPLRRSTVRESRTSGGDSVSLHTEERRSGADRRKVAIEMVSARSRRRPVPVALLMEESMLADALRLALDLHDGIECVSASDSPPAIAAAIEEGGAEIVLVDIDGPGQEQVMEWIETLGERFPGVVAIALTARSDPRLIQSAIARGAVACVSKAVSAEDFGAVVRQAARGAILWPSAARQAQTNQASSGPDLTRREREILLLVSDGAANKEVARRLWVTEQTVKFHLSNVYRKLNVSNRTEASRSALALGLVDTQPVDGSFDR
jgi:DNA-binding NarL/FixJ family response regulator